MRSRWPQRLWIVRHGESAGNVARRAAQDAGLAVIDLSERDVDVPLSAAGERQAEALGRWFGSLPEAERPEVILCSPYARARRTAELIVETGGFAADIEFLVDERLREKEFGILDRLTNRGIAERYPEQAEFRQHLGKFYHRPPGGESWCDTILRLRSALDSIALQHSGRRVLVVSHQVVVLCFRYLLENMTEAEILAVDAEGPVGNCSVSDYGFDPALGKDGRLALRRFNFTVPLETEGAPVTAEPSTNTAARA